MKTPLCPKCGKESVSSKMTAEEAIVRTSDSHIIGVGRDFDGVCSTHGPFWQGLIGNHSTLSEKQLKKLFPKRDRKILLAKLPVGERKLFKQTLKGNRMPLRGEVDHWREAVAILRGDRSAAPMTGGRRDQPAWDENQRRGKLA